jgi:cation diffusion facilitator CzcD-associated flavoprotein CzcO
VNQRLRRLLPETAAYAITRYKNVLRQRWIYVLFQRFPKAARRLIRWANRKALPDGYPVDLHFNPPYDPWDQRLCAVPDGDYFKALRSGSASIVTGTIERFTERGLRMTTGEEIEADVIVTATGLNLRMFGGADLSVDGRRVTVSERLVFKGMMLDGVPNFSFAVGYTNASWTLKVGLLCQYFCRLLERMDQKRFASVEARRPQRPIATRPLLEFGAGYVKRALATLPRQGDAAPWEMTFNYIEDARQMRRGPVEHPDLHFAPASEPARSAA